MSAKKLRRSAIWGFFTSTGKESVRCNMCGNTYSNKGRSTTPLKNHLKSMHIEQFNEYVRMEKGKFKQDASTAAADSKTMDYDSLCIHWEDDDETSQQNSKLVAEVFPQPNSPTNSVTEVKFSVIENHEGDPLEESRNLAAAVADAKSTKYSSNKKVDEFAYFGLNIGAQLRNMPLVNALRMQKKIQNMLIEERIKLQTNQPN